jgi:hypothetical protein
MLVRISTLSSFIAAPGSVSMKATTIVTRGAYLKDVLERLPTQPANRIDELLPHRWTPATIAC